MPERFHAVVIGASAGGISALNTILSMLPKEFILPIVIVQHLQEEGTIGYRASYLNKNCALPVKEAIDKEPLEPGTVYLAPPAYHTLLEPTGVISLSIDAPVNFSRPSIDVLFESAALAHGKKLLGIILTGANSDGSQGIKKIKQYGGYVIVQDPDEAEAQAMPQAAITAAKIDRILTLKQIGNYLAKAGAPTIKNMHPAPITNKNPRDYPHGYK